MYGKKEKLAKIFNFIGANRVASGIRSLFVDDVRIIAYHRICEVDSLNDKELVSANLEQFEQQVKHIKENYNAITFSHWIKARKAKQKLPKNSLIITFDDGFADNYFNAFKILNKYKVPATIFISTGYIDTAKTFWFNRLSRMFKSKVGQEFNIDGENYSISKESEEQEILLMKVLALMKNRPNQARLELLKSLAVQLDFVDDCDAMALPMTWAQVREMNAAGIEFGSHTVSHPILSQLTEQELHHEIVDSKLQIEAQIGTLVETISYPEGMEYAFNNQVIEKVKEAGYELGASYISGINKVDKIEPFQLKRMHIERYVSHNLFCSMLALPEVFA